MVNKDMPWAWFVALDGNGLDGLKGEAGLLRFDWPTKKLNYRYYDGISAGHNISLSPSGKLGLLGNFSQQLVLIDTSNLNELARQSTLSIDNNDYKLRSNTHHLWEDDNHFIGAIGKDLYRFTIDGKKFIPQYLGMHGLNVVHEMRWNNEHTHILMGDLGAEKATTRQVAIFNLKTEDSTVIPLNGTVWHVSVDPKLNLGYAATYNFDSDGGDYVDWSPAYEREYIFEIDLLAAKVTRHFSTSADFPIHLNSDLEIYNEGEEKFLYIASGGSHTVTELNLNDMSSIRNVKVTPNLFQRWLHYPFFYYQAKRNIVDSLRRQNINNSSHFFRTLAVTQNRIFDGIYCNRVSPDGKYIIAGNRGYNYIRVMERSTFKKVFHMQLPTRNGLHLGLHHSEIITT